jgi:Ser/Thr protein kinase RdoA (MazF antagonist)
MRSCARRDAFTARPGEPVWRRSLGICRRWATTTPADWDERLARARGRYPEILGASVTGRLRDLPAHSDAARTRLVAGPASWIQYDAHLDNVLWRPDGRAVLLDWSDAVIGPPAVDLARCLTEGVDAGSRRHRTKPIVSGYVDELRRSGVDIALDEIWSALDDALTLLVQTAVVWAGRVEEAPPTGRTAELRANLLRSACAWLPPMRGRPWSRDPER